MNLSTGHHHPLIRVITTLTPPKNAGHHHPLYIPIITYNLPIMVGPICGQLFTVHNCVRYERIASKPTTGFAPEKLLGNGRHAAFSNQNNPPSSFGQYSGRAREGWPSRMALTRAMTLSSQSALNPPHHTQPPTARAGVRVPGTMLHPIGGRYFCPLAGSHSYRPASQGFKASSQTQKPESQGVTQSLLGQSQQARLLCTRKTEIKLAISVNKQTDRTKAKFCRIREMVHIFAHSHATQYRLGRG